MKQILLHVVTATQILICASRTSAQIIYTDFIPDIYLTNQPVNGTDSAYIDVDQDSLIDFTVRCSSFLDGNNYYNTNNHIRLIPTQLSFAFDSSPISQSVCGRINLGSNQFVGSNFDYPQTFLYAYFYRDGPLAQCGYGLDTSARYYPFAKFINNDTLYGWVQISSNGISMTIHDLAINLTPNIGFYTGQVTGLSSIPDKDNLFRVFPNPVSNNIHYVNHYNEVIYFEISDLTGKSLSRNKIVSRSDIIDIHKLNSGLYFYKIYNEHNLILSYDLFVKLE